MGLNWKKSKTFIDRFHCMCALNRLTRSLRWRAIPFGIRFLTSTFRYFSISRTNLKSSEVLEILFSWSCLNAEKKRIEYWNLKFPDLVWVKISPKTKKLNANLYACIYADFLLCILIISFWMWLWKCIEAESRVCLGLQKT